MVDVLSMNIRAAQCRTGLGRTKLYAEMASGRLRFVKIGARRLIRECDLAAWLANHVVTSTPSGVAAPRAA